MKREKRLQLSRETLAWLERSNLAILRGGTEEYDEGGSNPECATVLYSCGTSCFDDCTRRRSECRPCPA